MLQGAASKTAGLVGASVRRKEDRRLITGAGRYVDDVRPAGCLHLAFVRSPFAHAAINHIDTTAANELPGVVAVFTAADLGLAPQLAFPAVSPAFARPPLATDRVRFAGELVAAAVAETREAAADAANLVAVDYDPLPAVVGPERGLADDAPRLFPEAESNVALQAQLGETDADADVLEAAEVTVRARFVHQRLAAVTMEPNALVAEPARHDGDHALTIWASSQGPIPLRQALAGALQLDPDRLRVIAPDVGGGFGAKMPPYPEQIVVAALALKLGRPLRWAETRTENLLAMVQGRGQVQDVELGARRDGTLVGLRVRVTADAGAYPGLGAWLPTFTGMMSSGVYRIPRIDYRARSVVTNAAPTAAYRGAGRPEAASMIERAMDMLAAELHMDPVELRRRNLLRPEDFPYSTPVNSTYDCGDYAKPLDRVIEKAGYAQLRAEQAERRRRGDRTQLGIGLGVYVEITGGGSLTEYGAVDIRPDGTALVRAGTSSHGQGHETTFAQLAADRLGLPLDRIEVLHSDTARVPRGAGTVGSRSMQLGGSAVVRASEEVVEQGRRLAGRLLEADPADVELVDGAFQVRGVPTSRLGWTELAAATQDGERLAAEVDFDQGGYSYPFGAHLAVVEVDTETGDVRLVRHVAVDDSGTILNPLLAEGQQHGGIAQGAAEALYEEVVLDAEGSPRTASLLDYLMPTANELPAFEVERTVTPTPLNPLGAKGIGESGTIGSIPAVHNAVLDAVSHLGVRHIDTPVTPEKIWSAIRDA